METVDILTRRKRRSLATVAALVAATLIGTSFAVGTPSAVLAAERPATAAENSSPQETLETAVSASGSEVESLDASTIIGYWDGDVSDLTDVQRSEMEDAGIDLGGEIATAPPAPVSDELLEEAGECLIPLGEDVVTGLTACANDTDNASSSINHVGESAARSGDASIDSNQASMTAASDAGIAAAAAATPESSPCVRMVWEKIVSSRSEACFGFDRTLSLVDSRTMQVVGTYLLTMVTTTTTMVTDKMQVANDTSFRVQYATGYAVGRPANFVGNYQCNVADCVSGTAGFNSTVDSTWRTASGGSRLEFTGTTPRDISENWDFTVTVAGAILTEKITTMALKPRCDNNAVANTGRGCVYPEFIPTVTIGTTGATEGAGRHIAAAQAYGLPTRLTRTTPAQATANRNLSCPRNASLPRKTNWECDEYPFASTVEGGSSNVWITAGCTWPQRTPSPGEKIVSICLIPLEHNRTAGRQLLSFYKDNRIIPGDQFDVRTR